MHRYGGRLDKHALGQTDVIGQLPAVVLWKFEEFAEGAVVGGRAGGEGHIGAEVVAAFFAAAAAAAGEARFEGDAVAGAEGVDGGAGGVHGAGGFVAEDEGGARADDGGADAGVEIPVDLGGGGGFVSVFRGNGGGRR